MLRAEVGKQHNTVVLRCCSVLVLLVNCVLYALNACTVVLLLRLCVLQITVKHIFNILRCCASTNARVVLQAYNVIKKLCKVCYGLFVVYGFCYCCVVRHVVTLLCVTMLLIYYSFSKIATVFLQHTVQCMLRNCTLDVVGLL